MSLDEFLDLTAAVIYFLLLYHGMYSYIFFYTIIITAAEQQKTLDTALFPEQGKIFAYINIQSKRSQYVEAEWLLRGTIVNKIYDTHKTYIFNHFY